jgi:hypothetical protein
MNMLSWFLNRFDEAIFWTDYVLFCLGASFEFQFDCFWIF